MRCEQFFYDENICEDKAKIRCIVCTIEFCVKHYTLHQCSPEAFAKKRKLMIVP